MKRGDKATITVCGEKLPATFLGKGHWSTGYLVDSIVYLFTKGDYLKEAAMHAIGEHLPPVKWYERLERYPENIDVYSMPYYRNITAQDKEAWAILRELKRTAERVHVASCSAS